MDILNKNGQILLDYRTEFKRHYAESVDEALKNAVYILYKENRINEKLFRMILNEEMEDLEVYTYLLTQKEFIKTPAEMNYEFDVVRQKVNDYLIRIGLINNVSTKNSISTNKIIVIRQFDVSKEILLQYFGLSQTEIVPLMKRRGFMDKFCVLRLNQIFKEIYSELKIPEHIDHGYSLVYYNKEIQGFSIDYKYSVNVNFLNDENNMKDVLNKVKDLDRACEKKFQNKINFIYFSSQGGSPNKKGKPEVQETNEIKLPEPTRYIEPLIPKPPEVKKKEDIQAPSMIVETVKSTSNNTTPKPADQPSQGQKPHSNPGISPQPKQPPEAPNKPKEPIAQQVKPHQQNEQKPQQKLPKQENIQPKREEIKIEQKGDIKPKKEEVFVNIPPIEIDEDDKDLL